MLHQLPLYMCCSCKRHYVEHKGDSEHRFCPPCERAQQSGFTFSGSVVFGHATIMIGLAWDGRLMLNSASKPESPLNGVELARVVHHVLNLPESIEIQWTMQHGIAGFVEQEDGSGFTLYGYRMSMPRARC